MRLPSTTTYRRWIALTITSSRYRRDTAGLRRGDGDCARHHDHGAFRLEHDLRRGEAAHHRREPPWLGLTDDEQVCPACRREQRVDLAAVDDDAVDVRVGAERGPDEGT